MKKTFLTALESRLFYAQKLFFYTSLSLLSSKNSLFHKPKAFCLHKPFHITLKKQPFSATNTANSHQAITYCPPKNTAILLQSALNPYAVKPEPRTDSKPFRRRFVGKTGFGRSCRKTLQNHFRQSFESSPESRGSQTSGVLFGSFCTTQKERKNVSFAESIEVSQTSNQHTAVTFSHCNN